MMQFAIDQVSINRIKDWEKNPRKHDVEALKASIDRFGFRNVVVVNRATMTCEAGHGRLAAARALGLTEVPVLFVDDDDETAAAFAIADNRQSELSWWDEDKLAEILTDISRDSDSLLDAIGYSTSDLDAMLARLNPDGNEGAELLADASGVLNQKLDTFLNAQMKQLVLIFTAAEFDDVLRQFEAIRTKEGVATNTEVVQMLLALYKLANAVADAKGANDNAA
jgi:ParB-like chromosome segregation protein Spo0J